MLKRFVLIGVYALIGCQLPAAPPQVTQDPELESLKAAVAWPGSDDVLVMSLVSHYSASHRDEDAHAYFLQLHAAYPERPLFLALAGLYRARMAGQITLTSRVAWVEDAIAMLDQAADQNADLPRVIRGLTLGLLPERFGQAPRAADELTFILQSDDSPLAPGRITVTAAIGLRRACWQSLARAYDTLHRPVESADALRRSGAPSLDDHVPLLATPFSVTAADGFRFGPQRIWSPQPGMYVATGYDFADLVFIETSAGVIAIDAGTTPETAQRAWEAFSAVRPGLAIHTVIITHGHWDHIGGLTAFQHPGVQVIAQSRFAEEAARSMAAPVGYRYFFGRGYRNELLAAAKPTRLISERTPLQIGGLELVLHPAHGGETDDALLVELPATGLVVVGDAFMPFLGAPFVAEGSAEGLLDTMAALQEMGARKLVHGHAPLSDIYTAEALAPLESALRELHTRTVEGVSHGLSIAEMQQAAFLPESLAAAPAAVLPYLVMRDNFIARIQRVRTGYWQPDGTGLKPHTRAEWGAALDLIAGGGDGPFQSAVTSLIARGDHAMALEIADAGLVKHPDSEGLQTLRRRALDGLREKYSGTNPFKFIIYSEMAGAETPPLDDVKY